MDNNFSDWLRERLNEHGWTQAELSRRSGVSTAQITRVLSGERGLGESSILSIANAFNLPPEQVYRAAGLLPPENEENIEREEINYLINQLSSEDRAEIIELLRFKVSRNKPTTDKLNLQKSSRSKRPARTVF